MTITPKDISKLSEHLDIIETLAWLTPASVDDSIIRILRLVDGDEDLINELATYLSIIPPGPDSPLPVSLEPEHYNICQWRAWLWES